MTRIASPFTLGAKKKCSPFNPHQNHSRITFHLLPTRITPSKNQGGALPNKPYVAIKVKLGRS